MTLTAGLAACCLLVLGYCQVTFGRCVFSQQAPASHEQSSVPFAMDIQPLRLIKVDTVCPEFAGLPVCCNGHQIETLSREFDVLDAAAPGCAACADNLKRVLCAVTCSPQQSDFVAVGAPIAAQPFLSMRGVSVPVLPLEISLHRKTAEDIFASCTTWEASLSTSPSKNVDEFLDQLGSKQVHINRALLRFKLANSEGLQFVAKFCDPKLAVSDATELSMPAEVCGRWRGVMSGDSSVPGEWSVVIDGPFLTVDGGFTISARLLAAPVAGALVLEVTQGDVGRRLYATYTLDVAAGQPVLSLSLQLDGSDRGVQFLLVRA